MARNLVKEKEALIDEDSATPRIEHHEVPTNENVSYVYSDQIIMNNLQVIMSTLTELNLKMMEGFKQVGVKFPDDKN